MSALDVALWALLVLVILGSLTLAPDAEPIKLTGRRVFAGLLGIAVLAVNIWLAVLTGYWQIGAASVSAFIIRYAAGQGRDS